MDTPLGIKYQDWLKKHFPESAAYPRESSLENISEHALLEAIEDAKIGVLAERLVPEHEGKFHFALGLCIGTKWRRFRGKQSQRQQTNQSN